MAGAAKGGAKSGSSSPNGAILDDTMEVLRMRRQRFNAWKEGHRKKVLDSSGKGVAFSYENSPKPTIR